MSVGLVPSLYSTQAGNIVGNMQLVLHQSSSLKTKEKYLTSEILRIFLSKELVFGAEHVVCSEFLEGFMQLNHNI